MPDSLTPPCDEGGDGDCGHESLDVSVEAGGDTAPVLEATDHTFDDVALAVDGTVVVYLDLAVGLGRDDRHGVTLDQPERRALLS